MWPCKNQGEDAALYKAVKACSDFACALGINIPTGKDSLSMTQKYGDRKVLSPGTVIISAAGSVPNIRKVLTPDVDNREAELIYIGFTRDELKLGGSAFEQALDCIGSEAPSVSDPAYFAAAFNAVQSLQDKDLVLAQHDVSAGGLITALLEMCFANTRGGMQIDLDIMQQDDVVKALFAENPAIVLQTVESEQVLDILAEAGVHAIKIGKTNDVSSKGKDRIIDLKCGNYAHKFAIEELRLVWYQSSYELDKLQTAPRNADSRLKHFGKVPLEFKMPKRKFTGTFSSLGLQPTRTQRTGIMAAIVREKGVNGDREMAYALHLAGFDVRDVHMTDLISGRETLEDINMLVFCGGFSNSDVLGSAKGWAGAFLHNEKARKAITNYYARPDTLSLGVCNGCQLMVELGLVGVDENGVRLHMEHNLSQKFESGFVSVKIPSNNTVMLNSLGCMTLGVWIAHAEGRFTSPYINEELKNVMKYNHSSYPANPNGSRGGIAAIASKNGRHLAMMPHLERSIFPWQCGYWPREYKNYEITPWIEAFVNARYWIQLQLKQ